MPRQIRVFAPGSIGNVGPGLDILGLAVAGAGDTVEAERQDRTGVEIVDPGHPALPVEPERHASAIAAAAVLRRAGAAEAGGIRIRVTKGLPLSGGQGGSAASAVAAAVAANLLLDSPLSTTQVLAAALDAETAVAGRHADNVAPSLLGGLVLIRSLDPLDVVRLPVPESLRIVLAQPAQALDTRDGRAVLPDRVSRDIALHQAAQVAAIVAAAQSGDVALLGRAIEDRIAEPARAPLLPGFVRAKMAALSAGAVGCSISGSGPTAFAFTEDDGTAERVAVAMRRAYENDGIACVTRITTPDLQGARQV
ncbi:MAG: homoserine kinase [Gemmatimonadales bacterium]